MKNKIKCFLVAFLCLTAVGCTQVIGNTDSREGTSSHDTVISESLHSSSTSTSIITDTTDTTDITDTSQSIATESETTTLQSEYPSVSNTLAPDITVTTATTTTATTTTSKTTTATTTTSNTIPPSNNSYAAVNYSEMKAVWISYLEYDSMLKGMSESQFATNIGKAFDNSVNMGLNTVIVHVRAHGDAYYESELFPWASRVTGTIAKASSFDPLEIMIEQAHKRGLSVHAWINPFRAMSDSQISSVPEKYPIGKWYADSSKRGTFLVKNGDLWYLNPAYPEVRKLIADGVSEIVGKYNVDGMHIDDYFYPTTDKSFDSAAFAASGATVLSEWRMTNVDNAVKAIYDSVKAVNSSVVFGISPQGSISNNYNNMYADVKKWCSTPGYLDYIAPQIYYGFQNSTQPYTQTLKEWDNMINAPNIKLVVGLAAYKIGDEDKWAGTGKSEWQSYTDIIKRQIENARGKTNYAGIILYRYDSIFNPATKVKTQVEKEVANFLPLLK